MRAADQLSLSQLSERIDELEGIKDKLPEDIDKRIWELTTLFNNRNKNNFNKGVVNPLPPDALDVDNRSVITPKPPTQVEREYSNWVKDFDG